MHVKKYHLFYIKCLWPAFTYNECDCIQDIMVGFVVFPPFFVRIYCLLQFEAYSFKYISIWWLGPIVTVNAEPVVALFQVIDFSWNGWCSFQLLLTLEKCPEGALLSLFYASYSLPFQRKVKHVDPSQVYKTGLSQAALRKPYN